MKAKTIKETDYVNFTGWVEWMSINYDYQLRDFLEWSEHYNNSESIKENAERFIKSSGLSSNLTERQMFEKRFDDVYIPENAQDEDDHFSFEQLRVLCDTEWMTRKELQDLFSNSDALLNHVILNLEWEFPETLIENVIMFNL